MSLPDVSVVVPTLGRSPFLGRCLEALAAEDPGELLVVVPRGLDPASLGLDRGVLDAVDRCVQVDRGGFSAANNAAAAVARGRFLATVNDDAVVEAGWLQALVTALDQDPELGAVQGVNLQMDAATVDGCGIGWNRWGQAVQLGHGLDVRGFEPPGEIFGVSATAAVYRREALVAVGRFPELFDERLFAYYEDVDLAARLRAGAWTARCLPEARARHAGSVTGQSLPHGGRRLIHANRHLVLARLLGRGYFRRLPRLVARDLLDLAGALRRGDFSGATGVVAALPRLLRRLPGRLHLGDGREAAAGIDRFTAP